MNNIPDPLKPPAPRKINETGFGICDICSSSIKFSFRKNKCINPNCIKYYKGYPHKDINEDYGIYGIDFR